VEDEMQTRSRWIIAIAVLAIAAVLLLPRVRRFLAVDRCLDSGGCWDRTRQSCRHDIERCP
jgi:hypothetical protein